MTPLEYARRYWELDVMLESGYQRVRVDRYRSQCHSSPLLAKAAGLVDQAGESLTLRIKTVFGAYDERTYDKSNKKVLNGVLKDPFNGKGSPEEVQAVLQVAVLTGFLQPSELQKFCTSGKIGLDCCGFVSNYVWHVMQRRPWDVDPGNKDLIASNYIPSMIQAGTSIKTEADFVMNKTRCVALATADENGRVIPNGAGAHVMITEPNTLMKMSSNHFFSTPKGKSSFEFQGQMHSGRSVKTGEGNTFVVVESTGGGKGLVSSRYRILSVDEKTGLFHVQRGCSNGTLKVRMAAIAA